MTVADCGRMLGSRPAGSPSQGRTAPPAACSPASNRDGRCRARIVDRHGAGVYSKDMLANKQVHHPLPQHDERRVRRTAVGEYRHQCNATCAGYRRRLSRLPAPDINEAWEALAQVAADRFGIALPAIRHRRQVHSLLRLALALYDLLLEEHPEAAADVDPLLIDLDEDVDAAADRRDHWEADTWDAADDLEALGDAKTAFRFEAARLEDTEPVRTLLVTVIIAALEATEADSAAEPGEPHSGAPPGHVRSARRHQLALSCRAATSRGPAHHGSPRGTQPLGGSPSKAGSPLS